MRKALVGFASVFLTLLYASQVLGYTTSSNMSLLTPSVGDTDYPTSISTSFTLIDAHDHTSGKGVVVGTGGIGSGNAGNGLTGGSGSALAVSVDGSTIEINSDSLRVKDGGITKAKLASLGQQTSSSSGSYSLTGTTQTAVTNLSVSITTNGRPVFVGLIPDGSDIASIQAYESTDSPLSFVIIKRGSTEIAKSSIRMAADRTGGSSRIGVPVGTIYTVDAPAAGTYTYTIEVAGNGSNDTIEVNNAKLIAYEL